MATTLFDTSPWRGSHGREPRGFGLWAFEVHSLRKHPTRGEIPAQDTVFAPHSMNYAEAKRWIRRKHRGASLIRVLP